MTKKSEYRFELDAEWPMDTDIAVVMSRAKAHYGAFFPAKCVNTLYFILRPLGLALLGKSPSEVSLAVAESKDKVEALFEDALSMVAVPSSDEGLTAQDTEAHMNGTEPVQPEESVNSKQVVDLFEAFDDD